jgi:hypothetical protein
MVLPPGTKGVGQDGRMASRQRVMVWSGVGLAVVGGAVALVAWVGLDKANGYLGVPAAVAALLGVGLAAFPPKSDDAETRGPVHSVNQSGKAVDGGHVLQVGGDSVAGPGHEKRTAANPGTGSRKQRGTAKGKGSRVEQIGGNRTDGSGDAEHG